MSVTLPSVGVLPGYYHFDAIDIINKYFDSFEILAKSEKWQDIIFQGTAALKAVNSAGRPEDEAKICFQLASAAYYLDDHTLALAYANRCLELSKEFGDPSLFIRAHYLKSDTYRALTEKNDDEPSLSLQAITNDDPIGRVN